LSLAAAPFGLADQAFAHARLKAEKPAANRIVTSPERLILKFSFLYLLHAAACGAGIRQVQPVGLSKRSRRDRRERWAGGAVSLTQNAIAASI
jgi:methionine-rich copper-binding protein CopC